MQALKKGLTLLITAILSLSLPAWSQAQTGTINGTITDRDTDEQIFGATIALVGTAKVTRSQADGRFQLVDVPVGQYQIRVTFLGYADTFISGVAVENASNSTLDIQLIPQGEEISEVVVRAARRQGGQIELLAEQHRSVMTVQKIGAQELSRRGLGDAASAVSKMAGVSKAEGSNQVYVRGLGDRYNATSLNGLPLPSHDPEKKNIALDIFSTEIVEFIAVDKVHNSRVSGDFAGGNIDIHSKNYAGSGQLELNLSSTVNTLAAGHADNFRLHQGPSKWGFTPYQLPVDPLKGFNFTSPMNTQAQSFLPGSFRLLGGKSFHVGSESRLNFFGSASYSRDYDYREGFTRSVNAQGAPLLSLDQERFGYQTHATGLLNANYLMDSRNKLTYQAVFINSSHQTNDVYTGFIRDLAENDNGFMQRGTYSQTTLLVNQLLGNHQLNDRIDLEWGISANTVQGHMPDRIQNTLRYLDERQGYVLIQNTTTDNHRYNQQLHENEYALNLAVRYALGPDYDPQGHIEGGYHGRLKKRDFEALQFNFRVDGTHLNSLLDPFDLDAFFHAGNFDKGYFRIDGFAGETPQTYSGDQSIHATYLSWEHRLTDRLTSVLGARYEYIHQRVDWRTQLSPDAQYNQFTRHEILPNLHMRYELDERQNLRLAASKTYTLPQFKERALFVYEDIPDKKRGNPDLYPSENYNLDLKWEIFPSSGELFSVAAFGKYIQNPISETTIASSSNDISFVNTGDVGTVLGVEVELRKTLFQLNQGADAWSLGLNAAYMKTHQDLDSEKVARETALRINLTDSEASFTGASDLLINTDLSYTKRWDTQASLMATVAYSYASEKIYSLGVEQRGNLVDLGVGSLDVTLKSKWNRRFGLDVLVKNLLDPAYERVQRNASGDIPVLAYRKGRLFSVGVNYQF